MTSQTGEGEVMEKTGHIGLEIKFVIVIPMEHVDAKYKST